MFSFNIFVKTKWNHTICKLKDLHTVNWVWGWWRRTRVEAEGWARPQAELTFWNAVLRRPERQVHQFLNNLELVDIYWKTKIGYVLNSLTNIERAWGLSWIWILSIVETGLCRAGCLGFSLLQPTRNLSSLLSSLSLSYSASQLSAQNNSRVDR